MCSYIATVCMGCGEEKPDSRYLLAACNTPCPPSQHTEKKRIKSWMCLPCEIDIGDPWLENVEDGTSPEEMLEHLDYLDTLIQSGRR